MMIEYIPTIWNAYDKGRGDSHFLSFSLYSKEKIRHTHRAKRLSMLLFIKRLSYSYILSLDCDDMEKRWIALSPRHITYVNS